MKSVLNLLGVQGFFWFAWAFGCYQTVYLQNNGMTSSQIGVLNAISSTVAIVAMAIWGMVSDKINSIKKTLLIAIILGMGMYAVFPFLPAGASYSVIMFMIYAPLVNFSRCSISTLLDNITVRNCTEQRLNYGIIRAFGSFTFTIGSFLIVAIIPFLGVGSSFWMSALFMIPAIVFLFFTHDPKVIHKDKGIQKVKISPKELFKNYYYVAFMIFTVILYIPLSSEYSFITYLMVDNGIPSENFGTLLAVRALMEIPFLLIILKVRKRFKLKYLIMLACSLMGVECVCLGLFASNFTQVLIFGAFFGLGNGLFLGTVSMYLYKLAPDHLKATAQTIFAAVTSVAGIAGNFFGGFVYQALGGSSFYLLLGIIIFAAVGIFAISFIFKKNLINPADTKN